MLVAGSQKYDRLGLVGTGGFVEGKPVNNDEEKEGKEGRWGRRWKGAPAECGKRKR